MRNDFYPFNNEWFFKSQVASISKNLHKYQLCFWNSRNRNYDLNAFLLISLIFHFEIHNPVEAQGDPNDLLSTTLSSGRSSDP